MPSHPVTRVLFLSPFPIYGVIGPPGSTVGASDARLDFIAKLPEQQCFTNRLLQEAGSPLTIPSSLYSQSY